MVPGSVKAVDEKSGSASSNAKVFWQPTCAFILLSKGICMSTLGGLVPSCSWKKWPCGLVLIFKTSLYPKAATGAACWRSYWENTRQKTRTTNYWLQTQICLRRWFCLPRPSVHFLLGFSSSFVILVFFNKVARKSPGNTPPAVLVQVHRTMASHTWVNFSVFTVLRMMWFWSYCAPPFTSNTKFGFNLL